MFNDSMKGVSTLSFALFESVKDVIVQNNFETIIDDKVQFINDKGDIYIPYSKLYKPGSTGDTKFPLFAPNKGDETMREMRYFEKFRDDWLNPNITTIGYNRSISLTSLLKQLADEDTVYGVVLQGINSQSEFAVNPLHPMVAFLVTAGLLELPEEGKLHVFEWKETKLDTVKRRSDNQTRIKEYVKNYKKFFETVPHIIKEPVKVRQTSSINNTYVNAIIDDPFVENINATIKIDKVDTDQGDLRKIKSIVIPHQLIVDSTLSPYYGISVVISPADGSMKGYALSPMATGNISLDNYSGDCTFQEWSTSGSTTNVCTGSYSSTNPRGWFTLSRVNLNSMYYNNVIAMDHVFPFWKASKQIAADIWGVQLEEESKELKKIEEVV